MILPPPISPPTDTLFPYKTLFRSKSLSQVFAPLALAAARLYFALQELPRLHPLYTYATSLTFFLNIFKRILTADPRYVSPLVSLFRSEEHTSELQYLMRISYAVFCLKKKII